MNPTSPIFGIYFGLVIFFYEQTSGFQKENLLQYAILKSLPIVTLAGLLHITSVVRKQGDKAGVLHLAGLLSGACGDFVISFGQGLIAACLLFGIGHLLYMASYAPRMKSAASLNPGLAWFILTYAVTVNFLFILPQFFEAPLTTVILAIYSLLLGFALVLSGSLYFDGTTSQPAKQKDSLLRFAGYVLFFFSDSLLLLDHIGCEIPASSLLILSTYFSAQYLIACGGFYDILTAKRLS